MVVLSGEATLLAPYEVVHVTDVLVYRSVTNESASVSAANAHVTIHFVNNIVNDRK